MRNESLIWILTLEWPWTTQLPFCIKCTHHHQTTAKWLRMWKTAIPFLFKSPNLRFSKPSISVQIDKVIQSITISTEISKNRTRFSSNATKTRWFKFTEWWQRDGTKGFPRPEFYEHEKHVSTAAWPTVLFYCCSITTSFMMPSPAGCSLGGVLMSFL